MLNKLSNFFKDKEKDPPKNNRGSINSSTIYVVDKKEACGGDIEILDKEDASVKGVCIKNDSFVEIDYYIFTENSFKKEIYKNGKLTFDKGNSYKHCECILFPNKIMNEANCWILLIETKYAKDMSAASDKRSNYPQRMIEQIIEVAKYLRRHKIIPGKKIVHGIVSFPNLIIEGYSSTLFNGNVFEDEKNDKLDITDITSAYNVIIKPQNSCTIKSKTSLKF